MSEPKTIREFIGLWGQRAILATDLGVKTDRVHKWAQNNSIPQEFHYPILQSAVTRDIDVSGELLAKLHCSTPPAQTDCEDAA